MPVKHEILPEIRLAIEIADGEVIADDVLAAAQGIVTHPKWKNGYRILCDYRRITRADVDTAGVERIVAQDRTFDEQTSESMCAVVAEADYVYGMSRMWEMLSDDTSLKKRICRTIEEAMDWLGLNEEERNVLEGKLGRT